MSSSKVLKTRDVIQEWFEEGPDTKFMIFAQFRTMTAIFANMCKREDLAYAMGYIQNFSYFTLQIHKINRGLGLLQPYPNPSRFPKKIPISKIMIAALKAGGTGLDITAANKCILVEPWWNYAVQQLAFCLLFRIGQTRAVEIVKLVASNAVDDHMMELQKLKLRNFEGAIGDTTLNLNGVEGQLMGHFGTVEQLPTGKIQITR
ncbi:chromodomain-helicase-DNA-binding protein, putative [Talaromyces stipitatus ATCC 10500]|uniref:Chromodomain-helicase-DNA-binding protein, putative n=1 Tax=Talaromyces stipitatus (strain ATCC 10500 / CBS 375.48 / QM 6759 / NRRL 1006) TaxID=441959 RepID=B8LSV0_TALSN|nr:chromodomain-helicase-DNA-binding protein, putative [Talaromyces stipitatus ATCC 10500]EED22946.1 chromodomain-helicase-DNA-binding protein, putative [Talaromyces stipitatus ATCC 10500]